MLDILVVNLYTRPVFTAFSLSKEKHLFEIRIKDLSQETD